ncbi:MAG: divergent polysaccharide deacetylase family protein [Desulfobacteraceae bacterium]|nr:divergent polysaccharide deacetylase family protein [Desulfobacteraceae bacterium]
MFAGILVSVVLLAGYYHLYFKPSQKPVEPVSVPEKPEPPEPPTAPDKRPMVAIIIDDMGREKEPFEKFLALQEPFTYAILPETPFDSEIAELASQNGGQVMLHLPMEPEEYPRKDPGAGALLSEMTADERIRLIKKHLDALPHVKGVNNHMGSRMSENSAHMNQILSVLKKRGLYYIDSLTTPESRSLSSARLFEVPFAERDVFLDHVPDPFFIRLQLESLVKIAEKKGKAIGIAHPYPVTIEVLSEQLPELKKKVRLVTASEVVSVRKP